MIYFIVHDPDIYSPEEFYRNSLYSSVLLLTLKSWMRNCVILVDNQKRLTGLISSYLESIPQQPRKNIKICLEKYKKRNRIVERNIDMLQGEGTVDNCWVCQKIFRDHRPDAFIIAEKNSLTFNNQEDRRSEKIIALSDYAASLFKDEVEQHDFAIGKNHDYAILAGTLRFARHVRLLDRNIGRYWGKDYEQSLVYLFNLYRDIGEFSKEGKIEIITGLVENSDDDKKENQKKYDDLCCAFRSKVESEFPFQFIFTVKKEASYKNLPHPRYLRTDQFLVQIDAGFKFFNVATGKPRSNVLSVKEMDFQFEWDYEGLPDYTTQQGNFLMHQPFASLVIANDKSSVS